MSETRSVVAVILQRIVVGGSLVVCGNLVGLVHSLPRCAAAPPSGDVAVPVTAEVWVRRLSADSFHTRQTASQRLLDLAMSDVDDASSSVIVALRSGLSDPCVEIRLAADELLRQIEQSKLDRQIDQLKNPRTPAAKIDLPGWDRFSRLMGDDDVARQLFATIAAEHPRLLGDRAAVTEMVSQWTSPRWDPYRMSPQDHVRWSLLLWLDIEDAGRGQNRLSSRIGMSLSHAPMGPDPCTIEGSAIQRLISRWIQSEGHTPTARNNLVIAMRYRCHDQAHWLSEQMLESPALSASATVTAMLTTSVLGHPQLHQHLVNRVGDQRTAHVWQTVHAGKNKIRTQVRDVAIALMLYHQGLDPRDFGFRELEADPLLIFRDQSLGFASESDRSDCHRAALAKLGLDQPPGQ
ncbi:hypothetical protein K227x_24570 [Rubripirellula lacrimiformis]|uniref:Uncharacterized protein n=1 Tax=Rubripirellula lacrimiformis TaxID=1930273 RepID=A0A517NAB1_9BACT|nr:hypothetical protein [Rubripirellula lacrimiformis]QDT04071.1 hypothetical protein K227x_24570 [Rubripirellula lacrimiformis]